jgi:hypothetical protein
VPDENYERKTKGAKNGNGLPAGGLNDAIDEGG